MSLKLTGTPLASNLLCPYQIIVKMQDTEIAVRTSLYLSST